MQGTDIVHGIRSREGMNKQSQTGNQRTPELSLENRKEKVQIQREKGERCFVLCRTLEATLYAVLNLWICEE